MSSSGQICRQFSLDEIKSATRNFDDGLIIGKGGFGSVYRGSIDDGAKIVAIKRLSCESVQGETEFLREIQTLSKLQHDNLVRLEGYCNESPEKILVYEYMQNGTLVDHLYKFKDSGSTSATGDDHPSPLTWENRLNICIGAARGLDFLHRGASQRVIHRDIKGSNILLDGNFVAKIADFGLAKLVKTTSDPKITSVSTTLVKGTFGYMAPEYFYTQTLTTKTDIYAFGVVLLVVLSGRPAVDNKAEEDQRSLSQWATKCIGKNKCNLIIDPYLIGKISSPSLKKFVRVSLKCLRKEYDQRPTMEEVVAWLESALRKQPPYGLTSSIPNERPNLRQKICYFYLVPKNKQQDNEKSWGPSSHFSLDEIKKATNNFSICIGMGGFGNVYRGHINNGTEIVAVKRFVSVHDVSPEIKILCNLHHDHVVRLKGYNFESTEGILVYEYMEKGSLENHLYKRVGNQHSCLTWEQRLDICIGAARGLDFLHRAFITGVIHGNVKCSNIMFDANFVPKIADLGIMRMEVLARASLLSSNGSGAIAHHMENPKLDENEASSIFVRGTCRYIAPEHLISGKLTKKCDVYGLGVVLLVVLSGKAPNRVFCGDDGITSLVPWTFECIKENIIDKLVDPDLIGQFKSESLEKFLEVAQNCLHWEPDKRHTMKEVVAGLELALEKQLSSSSTHWVEGDELPNLLYLQPQSLQAQNDNIFLDEEYSNEGEYSSELYNEFKEEFSDM